MIARTTSNIACDSDGAYAHAASLSRQVDLSGTRGSSLREESETSLTVVLQARNRRVAWRVALLLRQRSIQYRCVLPPLPPHLPPHLAGAVTAEAPLEEDGASGPLRWR